MDEEALLGLDPNADAPYRQRAMAYFEQLKESQDAWEVCAQALAKGLYSDDHVKFFCFQVLEHQIKFRHAALSGGQRQLIRETLMKWLQNQLARTHPEKIFVRNKAAQVLALTFVTEYPALWPEFFFDVLALIGLNPHGVDIYLRTLMAVDGEVVDRDVLHAPEETRRNTLIKDAMREQCIPSLVESWFQILHTYQLSHPELTCQCLEVVGAYVSWIDLGLIANERFVELLLGHMSVEELREEACDCLLEIVNKGMDPVDKTRLVESLCRLLRTAGFFYVEQDVDFLAKLSRLVNGMGQSLVLSWTKLAKAGSAEDAGAALDALEAKVAPALRLLAHPDDDISANVVAFCYEYLHVLKQLPELSDGQKSNVEAIMRAVIKKLAYDDEYNFDNEGEDEAMFVEYRKQLKMLLDRLAQVAPELVLEAVIGVFGDAMRKWRSAPFAEVEVAVRLLYMLGEALPASHGAHFSGDAVKTGALRDMMRTLVTCGVSGYRHTSVTLDFFETVVRYDKFFIVEPQHIPDVLMAFLDQRGLRHDSPKVRSRAAYLFSRFIKTLHKHVTPFTEDILTRIQDLVEPAPPGKASSAPLTADDQLFVFEAAGVLIVSGESAPERKEALMRGLLAPPVAAFRPLLDELAAETDEEAQAAVADRLSHAVGFVSRTSKAFSNKQTVKQCGCIEVYRDCLRAFLPALGCPVQRGALRGCVRSFLHRMIICMEEEVLPFVPAASEHMLKDCEAKDLQEFIPLISQIAAKFKRQVSPFLRQIFMPLVLSVFEALARPADADDQAAALEKQMLRRSYFSFVQTVAGSGADEVLADQGAENVERVVFTVIQGAVEVPDPVAQKTCFAVLARLVELWGGEGGMSGFGDFTYKHIVPACFLAPLKPTFDLSDAQTTLTLSEVALTLKSIYDKQGPELLEFLRRDYLPSLRVCPDVAQELCLVLQQPDAKVLKTYLKVFFQRARL